MHLLVCIGIIILFHRLFASTIRNEPRADSRAVLVLSFFCLMSTELLPVLAHDIGRADAWLIALALGGFWLALHARYRAAAAVAVIGPLVHEGFLFLWSPVAILLLWSAASGPADRRRQGYGASRPSASDEQGRADAEAGHYDGSVSGPAKAGHDDRSWKIALAVLPAAMVLVVIGAHSRAAVERLLEAWPVSDAIKSGHRVYTFGQTLESSFAHMRELEFPGNWDNFAVATGFFLVPNLLMMWAAAYCFWRRWTSPLATLLVATLAMLAPLAVVIVGWDLSRFLCWSTVAAGIALVAVGSRTFVSMSGTGA